MRIGHYVLVASLCVLSLSTEAADNSFTVSPVLDLSYKRLQYTMYGIKFPTATLLSVSPSLNIGRGRWYASLSYETPIEKYQNTRLTYYSYSPDLMILDESYQQNSATFTVGYRVTDVWNVFGGILKARHEFNTVEHAANASVAPQNSFYRLDDAGVFIGTGYTFKVGSKSTLGVSLAYGDLDSKLVALSNLATVINRKAPSDGYSVAAIWTSPVADALSLRIGARYTDYKMNGQPITKHSYYTYFMGLASYF